MGNRPKGHGMGMDRRRFLAAGAAATAGAAFAPAAFAATSKSPNDKLNLGMIGIGGKGETNLLAFGSTRQNIVAVCDVDAKHAEKGFMLQRRAKQFRDFRKMLDEVKELDAVVVTTPDHTHAAATLAAIERGLHVYVEKPMAHSIHEVRRMRDAAKAAGVVTQMGNHGRAGRELRRAVEIVQAGAIGKVREMHAWTDRPSWPQGIERPADAPPVPETLEWDLWLGPAAERPYHPAYLPRQWRGWFDFGTGALGDMACHVIDLGFWALKLDRPVSVEAESEGMTDASYPKASTIRYEFPARGDLPPVTLHWHDGGRKPDPAIVGGRELPGNGSILVGDEGVLYVPETYGAKWMLLPEEKFADYVGPDETLPRGLNHYLEWVEACKGNATAYSNFELATPLTETVLLGNVALRVGGKIEWDSEAMKVVGRPEADAIVKPAFRDGWGL